jgi:hypothetical protein
MAGHVIQVQNNAQHYKHEKSETNKAAKDIDT